MNTKLEVGCITATLNVKRWDHTLLRPEIRYDRAGARVFKGDKSQLSIGFGLSYLF